MNDNITVPKKPQTIRPLVRAYGIVTGVDVQEIRRKERTVKAKNVLWTGMDPKNADRSSKVILRFEDVKKETPAFADTIVKFSTTDYVQHMRQK